MMMFLKKMCSYACVYCNLNPIERVGGWGLSVDIIFLYYCCFVAASVITSAVVEPIDIF